MPNIKRLHKIIQEMGSDPNVSMHELVREVLKQDNDFEDYYLDNISEPLSPEEQAKLEEQTQQGSQSFNEVQAKLSDFAKEDQRRAHGLAYDREATMLETIERLRSKVKNGWTEAIKPVPSNTDIDD